MSAISSKLSDEILEGSKECAEVLELSRAEHIRRALVCMNHETQQHFRAKRLAAASHNVREESMRVNAKFAAIEQDPNA